MELDELVSLDLSKVTSFRDLLKAMSKTAFGGRQLGEAYEALEAMYNDKSCVKVLTLSGAMTIAKQGLIISDLIEHGFVDVVVSTGALITHGLVENTGMAHFKVPKGMNDHELRQKKLNRVYDTIEDEKNLDDLEAIFSSILDSVDENEVLSSYRICEMFGKHLQSKEGRGIVKSAYKMNVPIFIPAFTDSELGLDFALYNRQRAADGKKRLQFNPFLDLEKYAEIITNAKETGIFTIGGGVPRNWGQQVGPYLDQVRQRFHEPGQFLNDNSPHSRRFKYGVRICPEPAHWGGLSGCTYSEGVSWGKFKDVKEGGIFAEVPCDATIALPILAGALLEDKLKEA